jgi:hypothetical protein
MKNPSTYDCTRETTRSCWIVQAEGDSRVGDVRHIPITLLRSARIHTAGNLITYSIVTILPAMERISPIVLITIDLEFLPINSELPISDPICIRSRCMS